MKSVSQKKASGQNIRSVLSTPSFVHFAISVVLSQLAFNTLNLSLVFLVFNITSSTTSVAFLIFTFMVPQVLLSFIGGVLADIENKKKILVIGNILRALLMLLLFTWHDSLWVLYPIALLIAIVTHFYVPAEAPYIPYLVPKHRLLSANAVFSISFFGSVLIGYIAAGPFLQIFGEKHIFLVIMSLFLAASFFASFLPRAKNERDFSAIKNHSIFERFLRLVASEFLDSIKTLYRAGSDVVGSFVLLAVSQVIIFILATTIPEYANSVLGIQTEHVSLLLFAPAAFGMILSSLVIGTLLTNVKKQRLIIVGIVSSGIILLGFPALSVFAEAYRIYYAILLAFLIGFANANIFVPSQTVIQEVIPDEHRSKVSGLLFALIGALSFVPILLAGILTDILGVNYVLMILGVLVIGVGIGKISIGSDLLRIFLKQMYEKLS